jgi:ribosomal protein L11 methyltransferase
MAYTALRFDTDAAHADAWSDALLEAGALCVDASDALAGTPREQPQFGEPGEPAFAAWASSRLVALFAGGADVEGTLRNVATALRRAVPRYETSTVAAEDWVRASQSQFRPIDIGGRLHVVPTWCDPPEGGITLRLDPGLAFGTGSHPSTRLCLEWLLDEVRGGESVLDYGCGSGVLAIAAAKLGAAHVVGTDVDLQALRTSSDNARANGASVTFAAPEELPAGTFDLVVANILANPLIALAPAIAGRVRAGGGLALSGILASQADAVVIAYSRWFKLAAARQADGWALVAGKRTGA